MLKKFIIFLSAVLSLSVAFGLTAGDIAILGVNTDATKSMVFVALEDIPAATEITFTDNAWDATNQVWRTGEGSIVWSTANAVAKGTVVTITLLSPYSTDVGAVTDNSSFVLSTSGDQILAYQGTAAPTTNTDSIWLYGFSTENWVWANNSSTSDIPTALAGANVGLTSSTSEKDNGYFANGSTSQTSVSVSGTKAVLLALFTNSSLYYTNDTGPLSFPAYTVTVGSAGSPAIIASGNLNAFSAYTGSPSDAQSYTLTGSNLTANIVVTPPAGFEMSSNGSTYSSSLSLSPTYDGLVYVRLTGTTAGSYSGNITHTSTGATQVDKAVSGTVSDPVPIIHTTGTLNAFATDEGTPSAPQTYTLYGEFLTNNIDVSAPGGFELSTDGSTYSGLLSLAPSFNGLVYVRLTGAEDGSFSGNIAHVCSPATQVDLAVTGEVYPPAVPTLFMEENFDYTVGTTVVSNGWSAHNGVGIASPLIDATNLTYTNYPPNNGGSARTTGVTGEDISKGFPEQISGNVYCGFLLNITSLPNTTQDYSFHLGDAAVPSGGTSFRGRLYVQRDAENNIRFGISKYSTSTAVIQFTPYSYAYNTTYMMVMKYKIVPGTANDEVYLWINPTDTVNEPAHTLFIGTGDSGSDPSNIGSVAIRQSDNTPAAYYDGIRIANDWARLWNPEGMPTPVISVTGTPDPMNNIAGTPSEDDAFYSLSGANLTGPITIVAPTDFEVSSTGVDGWANSIQVPAAFDGTIHVRLVSSEVGTHGGLITHNSPSAEEVTVAVEGETFAPPVEWNITANFTSFDHTVGTPSVSQSYTMSATNAAQDITVTATNGFELSQDDSNWFTQLVLAYNFNGTLYVRLNSSTAGNISGTVTHTTAEASPYEINVSGVASPPAGNYATDLFFSEYLEGSSNNKALEIYNGTGAPVDLGPYKVVLYSNGSSTPGNTLTFTPGTMLAHDDVYVIANSSANATILALADVTSTVTYYNGDDAVALIKTVESVEQYVDIFGVIGSDPGIMWVSGAHQTLDRTLVRKPTVIEGISVNPTGTGPGAFLTLETEWDVYPIDTTTYLGDHTFTPGAQVAEAPAFDPAGGIYSSTVNVSMSTTTPGATIYYTLDGSLPSDTNGFNYSVTGAPAVSATTTVKAITYATGYTPSSVTTATYVFPTLIADIATLRAQVIGTTMYKLTGEAVLTFQQATRHQKYIQDSTAAIVIDDPAGIITTTYNLYDGITGVTGTLGLYNGLLQFTPVADPGAATSIGNVVVPEVRTLASLTTADQAKLIKVMDVTLDTTLGVFGSTAQNINATDPTTTLTMRTFPATDYSGTAIPAALNSLTCLVGEYLAAMQVSPRFLADFELPGGLDVPIVQIVEATGSVTISWAAVSGATSYRVEWASNPYGTFQPLGTTTDLFYNDTTAGMKFYRVIAVN